MKWSKYNYLFKNKNIGLLYNSFKNTFIEFDTETYNVLEKICKEDNKISEIINTPIYNNLVENKVIVENDEDLFYDIKLNSHIKRFDNSFLNLTIAPTQHCNFKCSYCFEKNRTQIYMDDKVRSGLISFIDNYKNIEKIFITWYGGEPLLAFNTMLEISKSIKSKKIPYEASLITNGYLLNDDVINSIEELNIKDIQITIDGLEKMHNKRRPHVKNNDSFSVVVGNIANLVKHNKNVKLVIRTNIDSQNAHEFKRLYDFFYSKFDMNNILFYPSFVSDGSYNSGVDCTYNRQKQADFMLQQYYQNNMYMHFYPMSIHGECMARQINSWLIGPQGDVYKCWYDLGDKNKVIFNLVNPDEINHNLLTRYLTGADQYEDKECKNCSYLPICGGGCVRERLNNLFERDHYDHCSINKGNLTDFLRIHYDVKQLIELKKHEKF